MGFVYQLPWRAAAAPTRRHLKHQRLADERRVCDVQRPAVHGHRQNGDVLNTPENQRLADSGRRRHVWSARLAAPARYYDPAAWSVRARRRSATRDATSSAVRADSTSTRRSSAASRSAARGGSSSACEAANLTNTPNFRQPNGDVTSGDFMRITARQQSGTTASARFELGCASSSSARSRLTTKGPAGRSCRALRLYARARLRRIGTDCPVVTSRSPDGTSDTGRSLRGPREVMLER